MYGALVQLFLAQNSPEGQTKFFYEKEIST